MSNPNFDDTAPNLVPSISPEPSLGDTSPHKPVNPKVKKNRRWPWILLGLLIVLLATGAGGYTGYNNAVVQRIQKEQNAKALKAATQYELGVQDIIAKRYENALKRFQYVVQLDPNYPGVAQKLSEVMLAMAVTASPMPSPTVTVTPTPDLRGEEELFTAARAALAGQEWQKSIDILDSLRKLNKTYHAIEVDGTYYVALRNLGMDKVRRGQLEEGIYDMSLMERFGPIDKEADAYRGWARLYITGASFWELDWVQVINYFSQLYPSVPMLSDSSGVTATERYRQALYRYGDKLAADEDYCGAEEQYKLALQIGPDSKVSARATETYRQCHPPTATPRPVTPTEELLPTEPIETVPVPVDPTETQVPPEPTVPSDPTLPSP